MKKCFKCNIVKNLTDFYKHPQMSDGYVNKCKECNKNDVKLNYNNNIKDSSFVEKERKRGRKKYQRLYVGTGKANIESNLRYNKKYPEKRKCVLLSQHLKKPFEGAEKHHWSYNIEHAKDVIWLSKKHHMKAHRFIQYDEISFKYRRLDTNELLNTKQEHELFIHICIKDLED